MPNSNPFTRAQSLISQALTLLEASSATPQLSYAGESATCYLPPESLVDAVDSLHCLRLLCDVYGKRTPPTLSRIEYGIISDDFAMLDTLLYSPRYIPIRALVSQAQRIIAGCAVQPASVDVVREGVQA